MSINLGVQFTEHDCPNESHVADTGLDAYRWLHSTIGELAQEFDAWPDSTQWIGTDMIPATMRTLAECGVIVSIYNDDKPHDMAIGHECALLPALGLTRADLRRL